MVRKPAPPIVHIAIPVLLVALMTACGLVAVPGASGWPALVAGPSFPSAPSPAVSPSISTRIGAGWEDPPLYGAAWEDANASTLYAQALEVQVRGPIMHGTLADGLEGPTSALARIAVDR